MLCAINFNGFSQTIVIDSTFTTEAEIFPFNQNDTIYGLGLSGSIKLNSDTSLIRIIFVDDDYNEFLVYEAYPYIVDDWDLEVLNEADETKYLGETNPNSISIHLIDASIELYSLHTVTSIVDFADSLQYIHKSNIESLKIVQMNNNIQQDEMIWFAGETAISQLSYAEKKILVGDNYNLLGLDYYTGGIYEPFPDLETPIEESNLVPDFDWRNRHGANNPEKYDFYYDGDPTGSGWLTSIKDQNERVGCTKLCYIYGPVAVLEGLVNVYFNHHLNYTLSEQQVLDCDNNITDECEGGLAVEVNSFFQTPGVVNEECYPTGPPNGYCLPTPLPQLQTCQITTQGTSDANPYPYSADQVRENLILHGPILSLLKLYSPGSTLPHLLALIGYGVLKEGDFFHENPRLGGNNTIYLDEFPQYIGQSYWKYKNSWGDLWGDQGYMYHLESQLTPEYCKYYNLPLVDIFPNTSTPDLPGCYDKDKDGYFNWGISVEKPGTCPTCPEERDSDDSEPRIGPFDGNYFGVSVRPVIELSGTGNIIDKDGFFVFLDTSQNLDIIFTIKNSGNAKLNLNPITPVSSSNIDLFTPISPPPDVEIAMNGGTTTFTIHYTYTGGPNEDEAIITIHTLEPEYGDFQFMIKNMDCSQQPGSNINIDTPTTWDDWDIIDANVYVSSELTITGTYGFIDDVDLNVKPGGRVIIEGGLLTNVCSSTWKGVDVWGNDELSQYPISNQGYLGIVNGGTIKNAEQAVQVANASSLTSYAKGTSGGIVKCDSAIFLNNVYDVIIYPYRNINPGTGGEVPNFCTFRNSYFLTDYGAPESVAHVYLRDVDGIKFRGCTFENKTDFVYNGLNEKVDVGIYSYNSGFYVEDYCTDYYTIPCEHTKLSRFNKLRYGIYAINSTASKYISIDTAIFLNNLTGIYMSAVDNQRITSNDISINHYQDFAVAYDNAKPVGLYLEACKYYMIEENTFINESTINNATGIHILNSGPYANEVYNNSFNGFYSGITAAGENRNGTEEGLCLKCNDFRNCETDINITDDGGSVSENFGIRQQQGSANGLPDGPAGNTFTDENNYPVVKNVANNTNSINYAHHTNQDGFILRPNPVSSSNVGLEEDEDANYSKVQSCPSNLGGGIDPQSEMITLTFETSQVVAYEDTLNQVVDGGNTDGLNLDVQTSFPNEALEIRQELLIESPYLSDTVMETAIAKENVLPNVMIRDILVANPQSAKSAEVLNTLDDRFTPMPDYMMAEIMQGQNTIGAKEVLEQELAYHKTTRSKSYQNLVRHYLLDTINDWALDSMASLHLNESSPGPHYEAAFLYLDCNDSLSMQNTLDNIPAEFDLSDREESIYDLFIDYFNILHELHTDSVSLIDSIQQLALMDIADNLNLLPGIYARNLLLNYGLMEYKETVYLPESLKHAPIIESPSFSNTENAKLIKVYPNPAGTYFIIEYDLRETFGVAVVILSDINGRMLDSFALKDKQNQQLLSTNPFSPGLHILQLFINGELRETHKLQIVN